jgi:phage/plasmid-associated DNA primase
MLGAANVTALRLDELRAGSFAMADLVGKLANIPGDEPDAGQIDEAAIKTLTGGDTVTVQRKYLPGLTFVPTSKILVCCNVLPAIRDTSYGTARRRVTIEWPVRVSAEEADPAMSTDAYWADEMSGILRWAYDGLIDLLARDGRPVIPAASRDTTDEQMEMSHASWRRPACPPAPSGRSGPAPRRTGESSPAGSPGWPSG